MRRYLADTLRRYLHRYLRGTGRARFLVGKYVLLFLCERQKQAVFYVFMARHRLSEHPQAPTTQSVHLHRTHRRHHLSHCRRCTLPSLNISRPSCILHALHDMECFMQSTSLSAVACFMRHRWSVLISPYTDQFRSAHVAAPVWARIRGAM